MNPIATYDFTLTAEIGEPTFVKEFLKKIAKQWVFQKEMGDEGYVHYQGRISLMKKRRMTELIDLVRSLDERFTVTHWGVTSNNGKKDTFYLTKADTRIEGPWSDKDTEVYIPRQIREIQALYPWQQYIVDHADEWDPRRINVIVDKKGNSGKSILKTYIGCHGLGKTLPFVNDYKDMMRMVMDMPKQRLYIIDMPRAINKERLYGLMSGIETLKDGYAFDDRYHFKDEYFDSPNIWVFTNQMPERSYLSEDRWLFWEISEERSLKILET